MRGSRLRLWRLVSGLSRRLAFGLAFGAAFFAAGGGVGVICIGACAQALSAAIRAASADAAKEQPAHHGTGSGCAPAASSVARMIFAPEYLADRDEIGACLRQRRRPR